MGVKISELDSVEELQNADVFPVVQGGETKKVSKEQLLGQMEQQTETNTEDISNIQQEQETQNTQISKNEEDIEELQITKADRTEIPTNLNQLSNADTKFVNETQMANAIQQETTARQQQDVELQNQIDAITSQSDVVDVVGTYAELLDYDTSTITENDIIKVLQDSTHENATSYFRWSDNSWGYVGSEGPFYTKGETDERLNQKANQTSLDTTNQNLNTLAGRVGTNETDISGIKAEQTTQNRQIATLISDSGNKIELSVNSQTYILTATLKNKAGEILNSSQVDLPLEAMIVNAEYDSTTKELVLTLQNGTVLRVSLADIVSGLVSQDDFDTLEVRVENLENDVADIKDEQTTQNEEIAELQEEVEILSNTVNSELEDGTATGESISVTDSANAPVKLLPSGRTEQEQTNGYQLIPTPNEFSSYTTNGVTFESYPDGTYKIYGTSTAVVNAYLNVNTGKFTSTNNVNLSSLEAGEYTYHASIVKGSVGNIRARSGSTALTEYGNDRTFTLENDISNFNLYWRIASEGTTVDNEFKIMLEKGSVIHDWEKYTGGQPSPNSEYPQQIHVVKGHNEFLYQNKNLFDKSKNIVTGQRLNLTNGNSEPYGSDFYQETYIMVEPNTSYYIEGESAYWASHIEYDEDKNFIMGVTQRIFVTNEKTRYIRITAKQYLLSTLQLEKNTKATSYVPHEEQTLELDLPEGMEMCRIGDYVSTFEKADGKWYITPHFKTEINNADSFMREVVEDDSSKYWFYMRLSSDMEQVNVNYTQDGYINYGKANAPARSTSRGLIEGFNLGNRTLRIYTDEDSTLTLEEFKAKWNAKLANVPLVVYAKSSLTNIEITDQTLISQLDAMQKILSYYGGTNITTITAGDLNPILNFDYKKSSNLRIKALENAVFSN